LTYRSVCSGTPIAVKSEAFLGEVMHGVAFSGKIICGG